MKQPKVIRYFLLLLSIALTAAVGAFCGCRLVANNNSSSTFAAETDNSISLPTFVTIGQDGYNFTQDDFETILEYGTAGEDNAVYSYWLYTNNSVSINFNSQESGYTSLRIEIVGMESSVVLYSGDTYTIYLADTEKTSDITLTASGAGRQDLDTKFYLVQTPDNYPSTWPFSWISNTGAAVIAPIGGRIVEDSISLSGLKGTTSNPIFVDFYHNGNRFVIQCINGIFTNTATGNKIAQDAGVLKFSSAGSYYISVYDKTATTSSPTANIQNFEFVITRPENNLTVDDIYIIATTSSGQTLSNTQPVNEGVTIQYYNLQANTVSSILIEHSHTDISGKTTYAQDWLTDHTSISSINETSYSYAEDGDYRIIINLRYATASGNKQYEFTFTILTEVHRDYSYTSSDGTYVVLDADTDRVRFPLANLLYEEPVFVALKNYYYGFAEITGYGDDGEPITQNMYSLNEVSYTVKLARPDAAIKGVTNGGKYINPVTITVNGVGSINVIVIRDNTTLKYTLYDNDIIPAEVTSAVGKYTIKIVDQMGNQVELDFRISRALNSATYALIIAGVVIVAVIVFIVVKTRSKVKVR